MKKFVALALSLICAISLVACGSKDRDRGEVYDKNQKMISEMTSRKDLKYFSDLITQSTENLKDPASAFAQLPKDAVVSREFRVITKDKDGNVIVNDVDALSILQGVLPNIIGEEELKNLIENAYKDKDLDLQELYDLMTFEELKDVVKEENVTLIAEADTEEEVKDTTKDLTDILNKDAVPNILKVIANTVQKEVKKSNEELEKIEADEVSLINTSKGEEGEDDINGAFNDNPDEGNGTDGDGENQTSDNTNDDGDSNTNDDSVSGENGTKDNSKENKENDDAPNESEEESPIAGEDGELYSEAVRVKHHAELYKNLVYRVKNSVSKYVYSSLQGGEEVNEKTEKALAIAAYGIITFGYLLDFLNVMTITEYAGRAEAVLTYSKKGEGDI